MAAFSFIILIKQIRFVINTVYIICLRAPSYLPIVQESCDHIAILHFNFIILLNWNLLTCVCNLVKPRIHNIWPARGFLSESTSNFSSPMLIASVYSSGWPRPQLNKHLYMLENKWTLFYLRKYFWYFSSWYSCY